MATPPPTLGPVAPMPLSRLGRVDLCCDAFEAAWAAGRQPRIEAYLADAPDGDRDELFRRLLGLELDLRQAAGEEPTPGTFLARFPAQTGRIARAFQDGASSPDFQVDDPPTSYDRADVSGLDSPPPTLGPVSGPPGATEAEALPVGTLLGDYELLEPIGQGGMGIVYQAWQRGAGRVVALKLIQPSWLARLGVEHSQAAITLFVTEARTAARLQHENIVTVHDVGQVDGQPYYSMRYIEGRSLAEMLRAGPLADDQAVALLEPVARAVHCAHEKDVLHRDLKPANILVDHAGSPFVADFGLAKLMAGPDGPGSGREKVGTPSYMSPEQAWGSRELRRSSDVYGLGATLYELLTGRPPFRAATPRETMTQVIRDTPVPPRRLNPAIGKDLEAICLKCLEKDPGRRYAHAADLAADLRRCRDGKPTVARPVGLLARAARRARRSPAWSLAVAAGLAIVLGLAARVLDQSATLRRLAVLARPIPSSATADDLKTLRRLKAEAAIEMARDGYGDLARDLLSRRSFRSLNGVIRERLREEDPELAASLRAVLNIPESPPVVLNPVLPWTD